MADSMKDTNTIMQELARQANHTLNGVVRPGENGFVILVFPKSGPEGGRTNYVSNCDRKDIIAAMKEVIARFEGQPYQSGMA